MSERQYMFGADPEMFVLDTGTNEIVSSHDLMPGTKIQPYATKSGLGAIQVDGVAAEFNISPATSAKEFNDNIRTVIDEMHEIILESLPTAELVARPTVDFAEDYMESLPKEVLILGCTADYNAWTKVQNPAPNNSVKFRSGGFHIHAGWTKHKSMYDVKHFEECIETTRQLDASLYLTSLLYDADERRRVLYGAMGAFRPKPYGNEYRPLSNAILSYEEGPEWAFETAKTALTLLDNGEKIYEDFTSRDMINLVRSGERPKEGDLIEYVFEYLPTKYNIEPPSFINV